MKAYAGETLGYAAEALLLAGDPAGARRQIDEARRIAAAADDRSCRPRLLMLEARVADALGDPRRAREALQESIAEARSQEAAWLELQARVALCERVDAGGTDVEALRTLVGRLTEGLDTALVVRARALVGGRPAAPG